MDRLAALLSDLELRDIRLVKWSGELPLLIPVPVGHIRVQDEPSAYLVEERRLACRFEVRVGLLDEHEQEFARIEVAYVVDFERKGSVPLEDEVLGIFIEQNAFFMCYPYIREAVHAMSARLGTEPVVLGILKRGEARSVDVTVVARPDRPRSTHGHSSEPADAAAPDDGAPPPGP